MITARVEALRTWMSAQGIDVLVVPTMDPHNSEYVPEHWKCRQWITGFTGSAGCAVVTQDDARLWTDSRYWLQATEQLADTPFILMREGEDIEIADWLFNALLESSISKKFRVAFPADMMTPELYSELFVHCSAEACADDPFATLWTDRPAMPLSKAEIMPVELAGESAEHKLQRLVEWLQNEKKTSLFVSELSEICWLLNLRGNDIPYNPFLICFFRADVSGRHTLYIHSEQITPDVALHLDALNVEVRPYEEGLAIQQNRLTEPVEASPIAEWRACKNEAEQQGFREAHIRDGVAMVRFLHWLETSPIPSEGGVLVDADNNTITEMKVDEVLTAFRAEQPGFCGLSFETIAAYGPHGAIVHYEATPETDVPLEARSLLLLDSGAHFDCGTTDITRTIALGELTDEERRVYTLVLKGHLQLANLVFPDGTTGLQLDTAARMAMWREGYDFGHGTGHGVGHRLGVHEGPVQIRKNLRGCTTLPFHAGQNITDEPGVYVPGKFGVRIENILFAVPTESTSSFNNFLRFEQHTLCPYDLRPIVVEMLTPDERRWLNDYHAHVREVLTLLLPTEEERQWLADATRAI
ncbi:MAG: aminopeptidase P family protein [Bacteroidales bacterium]|nr:aminopeptidase P family protein [Bacteroidales bacterium]